MKRITLSLVSIVLVGGAFVSYWAYDRYVRADESEPVTYQARLGDLREQLRVRGEVAAEREYDLAFNAFGTVAEVGVDEGQDVQKGTFLMRLDTTASVLERARLLARRLEAQASLAGARAGRAEAAASLDASKARLAELLRGALPEDLGVLEAETDAARLAAAGAEDALLDTIRSAYTAADDAVRTAADQMFDNPRTGDPSLVFSLPDDGMIRDLETRRVLLEDVLDRWQESLSSTTEEIDERTVTAQADADAVVSFLDTLALALNGAIATDDVSSETITAWRADVSAARAGVDSAEAGMTDALTALHSADAALAVAETRLAASETGAAEEEIAAYEALVRQAEAQMDAADADVRRAEAAIAVVDADVGIVDETIRDASLYAPASAVVTKIWVKEDEPYQQSLQGMPAISLATRGVKIQSEISELDISKIRAGNGNAVTIIFDAFPDRTYAGEVVAIDPKEIVRDSDTYFLVDVTIAESTPDVRRGMSADLVIRVSEKTGVLSVPLFMVVERDGSAFVTVRDGETTRDVEVETGVSDGDYVEIVSGIAEGDVLVAPAP